MESIFFLFWGSLSVIVGVRRLNGSYQDGLNLPKCLFRGKVGYIYLYKVIVLLAPVLGSGSICRQRIDLKRGHTVT